MTTTLLAIFSSADVAFIDRATEWHVQSIGFRRPGRPSAYQLVDHRTDYLRCQTSADGSAAESDSPLLFAAKGVDAACKM